MKLRRTLVAAAAAAVVLPLVPSAVAAAAPEKKPAPAADSLRALGDRQKLGIGTAVDDAHLGSDQPYTDLVAGQFSVVTPENAMKWESVEPTRGSYDWAAADRLVAFAGEHGQQVRGHTLLWHNQLPSWLTGGVADGGISKDQLREILRKHVTDEVTHFRGRIWQWDVANEVFANAWDPNPLPNGLNGDDFWIRNLGEGVVADVFRWAHQADPKALLFYNDYNIAGQDGSNAKFQAVHDFFGKLVAQGVPVDGIGEQGHLDTQYGFDGQRFQADLQAYADLGLKVAVTEADVRTFVDNATDQVPTSQLAAFAQPYEFSQMLTACQLVDACVSFTAWGVYDGDSWIPGTFAGTGYGLLYDVNMRPKPAYFTLRQDLALAAGDARHGGGRK
ncbi:MULTISPECIES: endo-1,4-beta-xylanase [Kitasatospora]|uniref:Beta-xylanase n=1 Tax=Kitasatospora setae (strain ATCC 33774 / DSM 43861 / JCM 3304 / KCC A-0304 / NBRC 14216 / KM-6054) TaxID=452652 RepID=E4NJK3_KITSK|nr:endo-1,4-beta-xylanase [Kitasatospora setae]BAJ33151.1 putative endo-1,4-beta-xylanase precursor [Kitasatospora setae KM-6054]